MEKILLHLITLLCLLDKTFGNGEPQFNGFDLAFIKSMHESHCILNPFCSPPEIKTIPPPIFLDNGTVIMPEFLPEHVSFIPNPPPPYMNDGSCCQDCSCDLDLCMQSGTCCPDLLDYLPSVKASASRIKRECREASLKKINRQGLPHGASIWMFMKCPDNFNADLDVKQRCENPEHFSDWDTLIPVIDTEKTSMYYQNVHCAECHNISTENHAKFKAAIECSERELLPSSIENVIGDVKERPDCNIVYADPLIDDMETCESVIKECNVTGYWLEYNPVTEAACHAYTAIYNNKYNNIFCYLCNERQPYGLPNSCKTVHEHRWLPSFSALLQFTPAPTTERSFTLGRSETAKCNETQIYDKYSERCRNLFCSPPKTFQDGQCVDIVDYLTGVAYEAFLKLFQDRRLNADNVGDIAAEVWEIYKTFLTELGVYYLVYEQTMYYETKASDKNSVECFVLHCKVYFAYYDRLSNVFVKALLALETKEHIFTTDTNTTYKMMLGYYEVSLGNNNSLELLNNIQKQLIPVNDIPQSLNRTFPDIILGANTTLVTKLLGCPAVKLNVEYSNVTNDGGPDMSYPPGTFTEVKDSNVTVLYICVDDFLNNPREKQGKQIKHPIPHKSGLAQRILSLVCTCFSILCLILTLITYGLFPELHNQPGINNIALVACLLTAQSLFQFGSDQSGNIPDWSCQMIGVMIHFFWLLVMFWMNVCCIHMFLVFMAFSNVIVKNSRLKQTGIYIVYTTLASSCMIVINIVVSVLDTEITGMGYGGRMCYIRDYHMVRYVFALPVGIIITFNLGLFVAVVIQMCLMPEVESETRHTRNFFTIYAKLSTLTGLTWIFGFIYFFSNTAVLEYLFIILNASQGVFLFLAFVCNKRVIGLYKGCFGGNKTAVSRQLTTTRIKTINFTNLLYTRSGVLDEPRHVQI